MELGFDRRLGIAGVILAPIGLGITILWPDVRLLGWFLLLLGAFGLIIWLVAEIRSRLRDSRVSNIASGLIVIVVLGGLGLLYWKGTKPKNEGPESEALPQQPQQETVIAHPVPPASPTPTTDQSRQATKIHARLRVTEASFQNDPELPHLNIFYDNAGAIPAKGFLASYAVLSSNVELSPPELLQAQNKNDRRAPAKALNEISSSYEEINLGDRPSFISVPGHLGEESDTIKKSISGVLSREIWLYAFVTLIYRDDNLPPKTFGVTQYCVCYWGSLDTAHNCGNRYVQKSFKELLAP